MRRRHTGFTLIELLVVISIIALLILIFVPQIPAIMTWYRVHLSKAIMKQLEYGVDEYKRVYREYPHDTMYWDAAKERVGGINENAYNNEGYEALYLALQGPDGTGWGPTEKDPGIREFGPIPESPGFASKDIDYNKREKLRFEDPFNLPISYYHARLDSRLSHITESYGAWKTRYVWYPNDRAWEHQRGADEKAYGYGTNVCFKYGRLHWQVKLTRSKVGDLRYPHNPKSYVIWMAGADERFGYWYWSQEHSGFVCDLEPEDSSDGHGICDDLTNF